MANEDALIVQQLLIRLPGHVITHDMGTCRGCETATESGMYVFCLKCLDKKAKELKLRLGAPRTLNEIILVGYLRAVFHFPLGGGRLDSVADLVCQDDNKLYWAVSAAIGESKEALDKLAAIRTNPPAREADRGRDADIWRGRVVDYTDIIASRFDGEISAEVAIKCLDTMAIQDCLRIARPESPLEVLSPVPRDEKLITALYKDIRDRHGKTLDKLKDKKDSEIDTSDIPELSDEFFKNAKVRLPKADDEPERCICGAKACACEIEHPQGWKCWRIHCQDCDWSYGGSSLPACETKASVTAEWNRIMRLLRVVKP